MLNAKGGETRASGRLAVGRWVTSSPHSVGQDQPLAVARTLMKTHGLRHLRVLAGGNLVGILSERDLYFLESVAGVDPETERVQQGMSPDVDLRAIHSAGKSER